MRADTVEGIADQLRKDDAPEGREQPAQARDTESSWQSMQAPKFRTQKAEVLTYSQVGRLLQSNLGRSWDDVYSDICARADGRTREGRLLRSFVQWQVEFGVHREGDKLINNTGGEMSQKGEPFFYVDQHGILSRTKGSGYVRPKNTDPVIEIDPLNQYQKIKNVWYQIRFEKTNFRPLTDAGMKLHDGKTYLQKRGEGILIPVEKRQLGKAEIKRLNLNERLRQQQAA